MIPIAPEVWLAGGAVVAALITAIGAYWASRRASRRMSVIESQKLSIDEAALRQQDTQRLIDNLRAELERVKNRADELFQQLERERIISSELRGLVRELTKDANDLRFKVQILQKRLGEEGV